MPVRLDDQIMTWAIGVSLASCATKPLIFLPHVWRKKRSAPFGVATERLGLHAAWSHSVRAPYAGPRRERSAKKITLEVKPDRGHGYVIAQGANIYSLF